MKIILNLFLVLCHTAWLFSGRHLIGRLERRHVILNLAGNSFHCRSRTTSSLGLFPQKMGGPAPPIFFEGKALGTRLDHAQQAIWSAILVLLSPTSQKISMWKNLARVAAEAQNGPGLWKFAGESGSDSTEIANWGLRYISIKTLYNNDDCLFRRHPRTPAICDTVVRIQPWTRKEKIGSKWVQT